MNITSRIRFFIGIVVVVLIVAALAIFLNIQMSTATSTKAKLEADASSVGLNYTGLVKKQYVEEGAVVKKGDTLFVIDSSSLRQDLSDKKVTAASLPFALDPATQDIILKANDNGVVRDINYQSGSFVPAGSVLATINTTSSLHVVANFTLSPPDYARINRDSKVKIKLPNNSTVYADIFDVRLINNQDLNNVDTVVKARLQNVDVNDFIFSEGTPVQVELQLKRNSWYEGLFTYVQNLFKPQSK